MTRYFGVVIGESLVAAESVAIFDVLATRVFGSWKFHLVSVSEADFDVSISALQHSMVTDDCWYAHFFKADELTVVYREAVFRVHTDPATWGPAVEHGLANGVPRDQLDFRPATVKDVESFFSVVLPRG